MKDFRIVLQTDLFPQASPVLADLLDEELNLRWRGVLPANNVHSIHAAEPLPAGRYILDVTLPSGQNVALSLRIDAGMPEPLVLRLPLKRAAPIYSGTGGALSTGNGAPPPHSAYSSPSLSPAAFASCWIRLLCRGQSGWDARPLPSPTPVDGSMAQLFELDDADVARCLQTGGQSYPVTTMLPPGSVAVVVTPVSDFDPDNPVKSMVDMAIAPTSPAAQAQMAYLAHGYADRAAIVGPLVDQLLLDRDFNPANSVLGGYLLLAHGDVERFERLRRAHLAQWADRLTDIAILDGWFALRTMPSELDQARRHLVGAARRGAPLYSRGLRLLLDGLSMMAQDDVAARGAKRALAFASHFAKAADWQKLFTTYLSVRPGVPLHERFNVSTRIQANQAAADRHTVFPWLPASIDDTAPSQSRSETLEFFIRAFIPPAHLRLDRQKESSVAAYDQLRQRAA